MNNDKVNNDNVNNDNIKVAVRVRPLNKNEIAESASNIINIKNDNISITDPVSKKTRDFAFNYIFDSNTSNSVIYDSIGSNIVDSALLGYNCCVLAYGQTGSGKTYTMLNYDSVDDHGLIPQIANALISRSAGNDPNYEIRMEASFIEIYAEKIYDLLVPNSESLKLHINPKIGTYVQDLTSIAITNTGELMKLIEKGFKHRSTSSTAMNEQSSRSHAIFTITFKQITYGPNKKPLNTKISKINLVDLAGSERVKTSKVIGIGFQEAVAINKSLSMLSAVFNDLIDTGTCNKFRSSVLTSLLADSISGRSKTIIIANISPASIQYDISLQTLFYVYRTKKITIDAEINETKDESGIVVVGLKMEVERLREELEKAKLNNNAELINKLKVELFECEKLYKNATTEWKDKLQNSYDIIKTLEEESKQLREGLANHSVTLQARELLSQNINMLNEKLENALSANSEMLDKLTMASIDINNLNDKLVAANSSNLDLTDKLAIADGYNTDLVAKLELAKSDIKELVNANLDMIDKINAVNLSNADLAAKLNDANLSNDDLTDKLNEAFINNTDLTDKFNYLTDKLSVADGCVIDLTGRLNDAKNNNILLVKENAELNERVRISTEENSNLILKLEKITHDNNELNEKLAKLLAFGDKLQHKISKVKQLFD